MKEFLPDTRFNLKRSEMNDPYFVGSNSEHYSSLMKYLNLNATLVKSRNFGNCYSNGTCTGMYSLLQTGQADFALVGLKYTFSPDVPASSTDSIVYGSYFAEEAISILSLPQSSSTYMNLNLLQIFKSTSMDVYFIFLFLCLLIYKVIKCPLFKNRDRKKKITVFSLITTMMNNNLIPRPNFIYVCITVALFSFFVNFTYRIIGVSINCDFMKVYPEVYYESVEQLVRDIKLGKAHPYCIRDMRAHSVISGRNEPIYKSLISAMSYKRLRNLRKIPHLMQKDPSNVLIGNKLTNQIVQVTFCGVNRTNYFLLRQSSYFLFYNSALAMNTKIHPQVRQRAQKMFAIVFEHGITAQYRKDLIIRRGVELGTPKNVLLNCQLTLESKKYSEQRVSKAQIIDLSAIGIVFKNMIFLWMGALIVFQFEFLIEIRPRKRKHKVHANFHS